MLGQVVIKNLGGSAVLVTWRTTPLGSMMKVPLFSTIEIIITKKIIIIILNEMSDCIKSSLTPNNKIETMMRIKMLMMMIQLKRKKKIIIIIIIVRPKIVSFGGIQDAVVWFEAIKMEVITANNK